ncbi:MAG TPA: S8 family serine peptidase [Thermoplasmata archaeon]|nr:S8 family serine peptidase [Thermoplasmata archaeon]
MEQGLRRVGKGPPDRGASRIKSYLAAAAVLSVAGLILVGTDVIGPLIPSKDADGPSEFLMVRVPSPVESARLVDAGVRILGVYPEYVLAEVPARAAHALGGLESFTIPERTSFRFGGIHLDLAAESPESAIPQGLRIDGYGPAAGYYIVKFVGPVAPAWKARVEQAGGHLFRPADPYSYFVRMDEPTVARVRALPEVMWVGLHHPAYKVPAALLDRADPMRVRILTFPEMRDNVAAHFASEAASTGKGQLAARHFPGGPAPTHIAGGKLGLVEAVVYSDQVRALAFDPGVLRIEEWEPSVSYNDVAHSIMQSGGTTSVGAPASLVSGSYGSTVPVWNNGIFGQGVVIGVADTGLRYDHNQFRNVSGSNVPGPNHRKVVRYQTFPAASNDATYIAGSCTNPFNAPDHGTHVVGTVLGYDNPVGGASSFDGGAPGARVSFGDINIYNPDAMGNDYLEVPADYRDMWDPVVTDGGRIHSNSWGSPYVSAYSSDMFMIDEFAFEDGRMLFTWAAGNDGSGLNTLGNQAAAKNALTVGSQGTTETVVNEVSGFSSRGPTFDGRFKPDVMAPGVQMDSACSATTSGYIAFQGTSMATPNMAASAALAHQYFAEGWYPTGAEVAANALDASHSLLKAVIINGANEMTAASAYGNGEAFYPNDNQGWGRVHMNNSLYFAGDALKMQAFDGDSGLTTGDLKEYRYRVTDATQPLRVTLVWNDYPATVGASVALVNNLDLTVTAPSSAAFKGNCLTGSNPGKSTTSCGAYDSKTNVEGFRLPASDAALETGVWTIRVTGANVPVDPQQFALVITGGLDLDYGNVQFSKDVYAETDTLGIRVEDAGASSPAAVIVTSALSGDSEARSLIGGSGVFSGILPLTLAPPTPNDGSLSVGDGDTLTVSYDDPSGVAHTATDTARVDGAGPAISNVRATLITDTAATVKFDVSEHSSGRVHYGPTTALGSSTAWSVQYASLHSIDLGSLAADTIYYYDVEAKDVFGHSVRDDAGGAHHTFKTGAKQDILLVDGSDGTVDFVPYYESALNSANWGYNVWHLWRDGTPPLAKLQQYKAVFWETMDKYPQVAAPERTLVQNYNNNGGRFFISSQDVGWDQGASGAGGGTEPAVTWFRTQMKARWVNDPVRFTGLNGIGADPISGAYTGGVGYTMWRDGGAGDEVSTNNAGGTSTAVWTDSGGAATPDDVAVRWTSSANNGTGGVGVWGGRPSKLVAFFFTMWRVNAVNGTYDNAQRTDIMDKTLQWLIGHDHPDVSLSAPAGGSTQTSSPVTVTWSPTTYGGTTVASQSIYYSPDDGQTWNYIAGVAPGTTTYGWDVSSINNGDSFRVKVDVTDSGITSPYSPALNGSATSGKFTIDRPGGDLLGPLVQTGSVAVSANPVTSSGPLTITATIDDSERGDSTVDTAAPAEYAIVPMGNPASGWVTMNLSAPPTSKTEAVTTTRTSVSLAPGNYDVYVRGRDVAGNIGPASKMSVTLVVNAPVPEIAPMLGALTMAMVATLVAVAGPRRRRGKTPV